MSKLQPLPDEILALHDSQTACKYCGISYLLLNKLDKMKQQLEQLERERDEMRGYIEERPSLIALKKITLDQALNEKELQIQISNLKSNETILEGKNAQLQTDLNTESIRHRNEIARLNVKNEAKTTSTMEAIRNLKHEFLLARNEMAHLKGFIKRGIEHELMNSFKTQFLKSVSAITNQANLSINEQIIMSQRRQTELDRLQQDLEGSLQKSDRLSGELDSQKRQLTQHISNQNLTIQMLERDNIDLDEKINSSNSEIMELQSQMNKILIETSRLRDYKKHHESSNDLYERKILHLETSIQKLQLEHKQELNEIQSKVELSARLNENSAVLLANQALAKKDAQMHSLENSLKSANFSIQAAKEERVKTIEAHQSRIKHLQEKYLNDAKKESATMLEECKANMKVEHNREIQALKEANNNQIHMLKDEFDKEMSLIQKRHLTSQETQKLEMEDHWLQQVRAINSEQKCIKDNYEREIEQLVRYIEDMKRELRDAREITSPGAVQEIIMSLKCDLVKKDNEISFLKETVRIECEERMGLVAMLSKHQQPRAQSSAAAIPENTQLSSTLNPLAAALKQVSSQTSRPEVLDTLSSKDAEFLRLFKNATAKNLKRLAKQRGS